MDAHYQRQAEIDSLDLPDDEKDRLYQETGRKVFARYPPEGEVAPYDVGAYKWEAQPAVDDPICRLCYEWRRYPIGQRHFGYAWWRKCDRNGCTCEHHRDEIWIA